MLTRRTFMGALSAMALWWKAAPTETQTTYRPYYFGGRKLAIDDTKWDTKDGYRVSLWHGDYFIRVVKPKHLGRAIVVPSWTRDGNIANTVFALSGSQDPHGLNTLMAQYESGPRFWKRGPRYADHG
jgi:hypothetical protein